MNITYDYYRIFYYVAKYHSFTQAARILLNNQPNITRCMNNLEQELGCRLFIRSNRGITLTPEGEQLYTHVSAAVSHLNMAEEEINKRREMETGFLSISASETALHGLLLEKLQIFHKKYPNIRIRISNHSTPQALSALKNGLSDFAVVTTPTDSSDTLKEFPLKSFREILTAGPDYSSLSKRIRPLKDYKDFSFISLDSKTKTFQYYTQYFALHGLTLDTDMEAATTDQILLMVKNNLGIGFLPEFLASEALAKGEICQLPIEEELPIRSICLVRDTAKPLSIAAEKMIALL